MIGCGGRGARAECCTSWELELQVKWLVFFTCKVHAREALEHMGWDRDGRPEYQALAGGLDK
jgi:hypothetical protein